MNAQEIKAISKTWYRACSLGKQRTLVTVGLMDRTYLLKSHCKMDLALLAIPVSFPALADP